MVMDGLNDIVKVGTNFRTVGSKASGYTGRLKKRPESVSLLTGLS
jgi:hypothetical protein